MKGTKILVHAQPLGQFLEGFISGTPKPGTCLQIKASVEPVGGRFTYEAYAPGTGDGTRQQVIVLLEDPYQGRTYDDAYVSGDRCFMYCPIGGEEFNIRKADVSGTASATEDLNIGEKLVIVDGTGKVSPVAVGVLNATPHYAFTTLETQVDQSGEALVHCSFNAN